MSFDQEPTAVRQLRTENARLKQRVFELEEKARTSSSAPVATSTGSTSVLKLIEHKDFQIQQYSARLEEKKEQLEEAVREVERLRLSHDLFESDPTALIGVGREGRLLLVNRAAVQALGEKVRDLLQQPLDQVDFRAVDPETPRRLQEALAGGKPVESSIVVRDRRIVTTIRPVGKGADSRGALIRIQILSSK
jgi:PAS domain-containing protein